MRNVDVPRHSGERTEARCQKRPLVAFVSGTVFDAPPVVDDGRRVEGLFGVVLRHGDFAFKQVEDVLAVVVDVRVERRAGAEGEQFHEHVVLDDEFSGFDGAIVRVDLREFVQRHVGSSAAGQLVLTKKLSFSRDVLT